MRHLHNLKFVLILQAKVIHVQFGFLKEATWKQLSHIGKIQFLRRLSSHFDQAEFV